MNLMDRFILVFAVLLVWSLWAVPLISDQIQTHQMELSSGAHQETNTSGSTPGGMDDTMAQLVATRSALLTAEEERTVALWDILSESAQASALLGINAVKNLHYEGDSRFVEKETPSLVRATITNYGFQHAELPPTMVTRDSLSVEREFQLKALIAWIQQKKASTEEAELILGGSLDLLKLQQQRMEAEQAIESHREQLRSQ